MPSTAATLAGLLLVAVTVALAAPAPAIAKSQPAENRVEGEYIAGNSYRVRYVADARGFHATVVFIGDIGQSKPAQGNGQVAAVGPVGTTATAAAANAAAAAADDDDYEEEEEDEDTFVRPPVVMSGKPSKLQDDDGIGCAIRNSLCGK